MQRRAAKVDREAETLTELGLFSSAKRRLRHQIIAFSMRSGSKP